MLVLAIIVAVIVALVVGKVTFRFFFDDSDEFWDCVRYSFTPDIFSMFRGEYFEDLAKSFKLSIYLILMGGAGFLTYLGITGLGR